MVRVNVTYLLLCLLLFYSQPTYAQDPAADKALEMVGENEENFITSEFVQYVYEEAKGISLPRSARDQRALGEEIEKEDLEAGDVVFFQGSSLMSGIYLDNGRFIIVTSEGISERNMETSAYWSEAYQESNRYTEENTAIDDPAGQMALDSVGENRQDFITSEFVQYVYDAAKGISLPRAASDQWILGEEVEQEKLQAGDVVFFQGTYLMSGIYIKNGRFVIVTSEGISERNMETSAYWSEAYRGAKRYSENAADPVTSNNEIVEKARSLIGSPYNRKGDDPEEGFNSGAFVYYVYKEVTGSWLSKLSSPQLEAGIEIEREDLEPGDLVFFEGNEDEIISGIYTGNDQFITASSSGVQERHMEYHTYYAERFLGAARYPEEVLEKSNPNTYAAHENPVIQEAIQYMGTPYLMTGSTLDAFDCSFLIQTAFRDAKDVFLPRISYRQWEVGKTILPAGTDINQIELDKQVQPGDVLYFSGTWQEGISHTAIYLGDNHIIHATGEEGQTTISYMSEYWRDHFIGAKRFDDLTINYENDAVFEAYQLLGTEYNLGGNTPEEGFDTGSFVQYVYKEGLQYDLPRYGSQQWEEGTEISLEEANPGDLLFFEGSSIIPAIYIGSNQMIVATQSNGVSVIDLTTSSYWPPRYFGARTYEKEEAESVDAQIAESYVGEAFEGTSSEFIQKIFKEGSGKELSSNIETLRENGDEIHVEELERGDLMFFGDENGGDTPVFAAIYLDDGHFVTVNEGEVVQESMNDDSEWIDRLLEGRKYTD
ncbi:NlpC/P60 family protein [Alteribacillus sp. JSM 102045]|uniref:NlpC/P60 family protein n=1 Tax=Alteribacillus sp. JSM 102045 TaxID=1562101 RepID=UPI0035C235C4